MSADAATDSQRGIVLSELQPAVATLGGGLLLLAGLAGFITPGDELLAFGVNALHNALHVLTGAVGLFVGYYGTGRLADEYNLAMGAAYGVLFLAWFVAPQVLEDLLNAGTNDAILHLGLAVLFGGVGVIGPRE